MMKNDTVKFGTSVTRLMIRCMYIETIPLVVAGLVFFFVCPMFGNVGAIVGFVLVLVGMYIFYNGGYARPVKDFAEFYTFIEPISQEHAEYLDKVGDNLLRYHKLFVDREYTLEDFGKRS